MPSNPSDITISSEDSLETRTGHYRSLNTDPLKEQGPPIDQFWAHRVNLGRDCRAPKPIPLP